MQLSLYIFKTCVCNRIILHFRGFGETGGVKTQILDIIRSVRKVALDNYVIITLPTNIQT